MTWLEVILQEWDKEIDADSGYVDWAEWALTFYGAVIKLVPLIEVAKAAKRACKAHVYDKSGSGPWTLEASTFEGADLAYKLNNLSEDTRRLIDEERS